MIDGAIVDDNNVVFLTYLDSKLINVIKTRVNIMTVILNRMVKRTIEFIFISDCRSWERQMIHFLLSRRCRISNMPGEVSSNRDDSVSAKYKEVASNQSKSDKNRLSFES